MCVGQNSRAEDNNNSSQNEEPEYKSVNYRKRYVLKIVKEKKKNCEQQRRNLNLNVKNTKWIKKIHVSSIFKKQNLANTLKSYAMSNLCTKYKILQKVKILRQKHKAKGINVN